MSNKIHNGNARNKFLSISKTDSEGVMLSGYPKVYSIVEAFSHPAGNEPALTNVELATLPDATYVQRLNKFVELVEQNHPGIELDIPDLKLGAIVYTPLCDVSVVVPPGGAVTDSEGSSDGSSTISDDLIPLP